MESIAPAKPGQPNVARAGCEEMRAWIVSVRKKVEPRFINITAGPIGAAWQPLLIWKNTQYATHRRKFDPRQLQVEGVPAFSQKDVLAPEWKNLFGPGKTILVENQPGDPDLFVPASQRARYEAALGPVLQRLSRHVLQRVPRPKLFQDR